jgi:diguanylate cyclase (GGDEF)-like protein/PAS domain S-box-containing protein
VISRLRPLRTRLALRSAALTLLAVALLGGASMIGALLINESRESAKQYQRLNELLDIVEQTVQVACFLDNRELATEVANGLLANRIVARVQILHGEGILVERGQASDRSASEPLERAVVSPFMPSEEVCRIVLTPNKDEIRNAVLEASLFTAAILTLQLLGIGVAVVLVLIKVVTRPIKILSHGIRRLAAEDGQKLDVLPGNEHDELGRLVSSVNGLIDRLMYALRSEREQRLQRELEERRYRSIFDNVEAGIFELDPAGRLVSANPAFRRMFRLNLKVNLDIRVVFLRDLTGDAQVQLDTALRCLQADSRPRHLDVKLESNNQIRWLSLLFNRFEQGRMQGVANDITERHLAANAAEEMAVTDALTGLGNRRGLSRRLQAAVRVYQSDPAYRCTLIMLDLDRFKQANDTFGHAVGDMVLQHVGELLTELVRKADYVARLGGDEFVVLLDGAVRRTDLEQIVSRFIKTVNQPFVVDGQTQVSVGASLGIAVLGEDAGTEEVLLHMADGAMYRAKQAGRNCYRFHQS